MVFLGIHQVMKYIIHTGKLGWKLEMNRNKKQPLDIVCFSYSEYAGNPVTRRCIIMCLTVEYTEKHDPIKFRGSMNRTFEH